MGNKESTETHGVPCSGSCGSTLPENDFHFDRILISSPHETYCFRTTTRSKVTIQTGATFGTDGIGGSVGASVEQGQPIYLYFRRYGIGEYYCWDCLVAKDEGWAKTLYLSLIDKGYICSYSRSSNLF